jgi:short-subunit dehydrogenase
MSVYGQIPVCNAGKINLLFYLCIMDNKLMHDKVVIITGASSGIGEALARRFALAGSRLVLAARRTDRLTDLAIELKGCEILTVETDVSVEADCRNMVEKAVERFGRIDVLINNAGISMRALFEEVETEVLHRLMDVNFWGTVYCTRYALPCLLQTKGSVTGVISIAGHIGLPGRSGYAASKFAVRGFLDTLRIETLNAGLHVLVAAPGFTASEVRKMALNAQGLKQGESPRNEKKMMSSETCAEHIFQAITQRKRQIILTFLEGKFTVFLAKFWPSLVDRLAYNHMLKEPDSPLLKYSKAK